MSLKHFFLNLKSCWNESLFQPIYSIKSLFYLIKGGKDYTQDVLNDLNQNNPIYRTNLQGVEFN